MPGLLPDSVAVDFSQFNWLSRLDSNIVLSAGERSPKDISVPIEGCTSDPALSCQAGTRPTAQHFFRQMCTDPGPGAKWQASFLRSIYSRWAWIR